jgi:tetratricopeptide (TPR) repeat protein
VNTSGIFAGGLLATALFVAALAAPAPGIDDGFTLADAIPNDVFFYVAERHNPQREFLEEYWGEVFEALSQSGVGDDLLDLFGALLGEKRAAELERLKQRASQLLDGVDWGQLAAKEFVFAERFVPPKSISDDRPPIMMANMIWVFRGSEDGAAGNYEGLVAILEAIAEEVNRAVGAEALTVERSTRANTQLATLNLLAMVPDAPSLPLSVARHDDVIVVALREHLIGDVLDLMEGNRSKQALGDDPRFQAAFAELPPAADSMIFFDMQDLLNPIRGMVDMLVDVVGAPNDVYQSTDMPPEAGRLNLAAVSAYRGGDFKQALALVKQAYDLAPRNSIVLYNLACFNALLGNRSEALSWLEKAVEGGFYAPKQIASDSDLDSLRSEPRYQAALAKAAGLAAECCAKDIVINSVRKGEAYRLSMQAWQVYEQKDYEQGLKLVEQAYAVAPTDSRVLYYLACFHALLGHEDKALDFLERAVDGGFYCPQHIAKDPDLQSIRSHKRYEAAAATARKKAAELTLCQETGKQVLVKQLIDRLADAVGILDYAATVESTEGYAVRRESVTVLVPDAKSRPFYAVFGQRQQLTDFDKFLPKEAVSFSVSGGFDVGELYKFLEDSFRLLGPTGEELLAKWAEIQKTLGVDVQKDIVDWIDGGFISVTLADGRGSVWLFKVTDEQVAREKVGAAVDFLSTKLMEAVAKNPALAGLAMLSVQTSPAEHEQLEGFQNLHFAMSPQPAVWGVADGYLIFGSSADAAALCLATARGEHPNIRENARVMSEALVPTGPFASATLTDRRNLGEELAVGMGVGSMVCGMLGAVVPDPKVRPVIGKISGMLAKLTPVLRKIDFYKSTASQTTFDGQTWHTRGVTHYFSPTERATRDTH